MRHFALIIVLGVLSGCITTPPVPQSRAEWDAIHTREFPGKSPEEVTVAVEEVLRLADHDFVFDYPPGQLTATRRWLVYAVLAAASGVDYWKLTTEKVGNGTRAIVQISRAANMIAPMPTVGGDVSVSSSGMPGTPVRQAPPYELFWHRVEHRLGLRSDWPTCDSFIAGRAGAAKARLDLLCSVNTDDKSPGDP